MSVSLTNRRFAQVSAAIYLAAGIAGFFVTGFDNFFGSTDKRLIILGLNPMHNVVHLILGTAWLLASFTERNARIANIAIGAGLLAAFVLGVLGGAHFLNISGPAEPDNYLHLIYGGLSLLLGVRVLAGRRTLEPAQ